MIFHALFFFTISAFAAEPAALKGSPFPYCEAERVQFCKAEEKIADLGVCLIKHDKDLSKECKQNIERFIQSREEASSRGGGALSSFGGPNAIGQPIPLVSYDGRYSRGRISTPFAENKASIASPIYSSEKSTVAMSLAADSLHLGNTILLDSGKAVPMDLYRVELGAQYFHQLEDKKIWSLRGSVGYAGDKPFKNSADTTYSLNGNYGFPGSGKGYWVLSVFFSNNGPIGNYIPLPGFAYIYKTDTFQGVFGFPILSMQWTPSYPWAFSLSAFGPMLKAEAMYGDIAKLQIFTGISLTRQSYIPSQRDEDNYRLTIAEKKLSLGVRTLLLKSLLAEFQGGRTMGRSVYIGDGFSNKDGGSTKLSPDWFISWGIKAKF